MAVRRILTISSALTVCAALVVACGGDDDDNAATTAASTTTVAAATTTPGGSDTSAAVTTTAVETTTTAPATTGPGTPAAEPLAERASVIISYVSPAEYLAPLFLADALGEFEAENLDVELVRNAQADANVLLIQDRIQMQAAGLSGGVLNVISETDGIRQVGHIFELRPETCEGIWAANDVIDAEGRPIADALRGKTVNFATGGVASFHVGVHTKWLESGGLTPEDVEIATLGSADGVIALKQGAVAATYLTQPFCQEPEAEGYAKKAPGTTYNLSSYMMSTTFLADQPDVAKAMLRAIVRTQRTYLQPGYHGDDQVMDTVAQAIGVTKETLTGSVELEFRADLEFTEESIGWMLLDQELWLAAGDILQYSEPLPMERLFDMTLAREVVGAG